MPEQYSTIISEWHLYILRNISSFSVSHQLSKGLIDAHLKLYQWVLGKHRYEPLDNSDQILNGSSYEIVVFGVYEYRSCGCEAKPFGLLILRSRYIKHGKCAYDVKKGHE